MSWIGHLYSILTILILALGLEIWRVFKRFLLQETEIGEVATSSGFISVRYNIFLFGL